MCVHSSVEPPRTEARDELPVRAATLQVFRRGVGWGGVWGAGGSARLFGTPHLTYFSLMGILRVEKEAVYLLMKNIMTSFIYSRAGERTVGAGDG